MVARWLQAKLAKRARERRAWARPYSIKSSAGANWHNGRQMRETPASPETFLMAERRAANEKATRIARIPEISEVRKEIPDPFFTILVDTPYHRARVYWNSQRTKFIIQYVVWRTCTVKLSITYPTFTRATQVFLEDKARWRISKNF